MADSFRQFAQQLAPRGWLDDATSQAYLGAHGDAVSTTLALWVDGVKVRFASTAPEDALPWIGDMRQLERAPRETTDEYRDRLQRCFEIHSERATKNAYRHALEPVNVDPAAVTVWSHYEVGVGEWWSEPSVIVDTRETPWELDMWDGVGAEWDDGGVWDLNGLLWNEVHFFRRMIRRWKWAGDYPVAIWAWLSGEIWDEGSVWDEFDDVWGDVVGVALPILLGYTWDQGEWLYGDLPETWDDGSEWEQAFPE